MKENGNPPFECWAIIELFGHRKLAGYLSEQAIGGMSFVRIDVPKTGGTPDENVASQFYNPAAVYCITPTTEELARKVAQGVQPAPVTRWELPAAPSVRETRFETESEFETENDGEEG